ncbi:MAG: glycoside hydrolase family 30 protein [Planctomycetota bacterium]|jgi:glucosylceramidase
MNSVNRITSEGFARRASICNSRVLSLVALLVFIACRSLYSAPVVKWWISSQDMKNKLSPQTDIIFAPVSQLSKSAIVVDDRTTYQTIIGLGSSLEHSTCYNISLLPPARQKKVLESIVDKDKGIGMNLMRICFGTADFTASAWYSYDDPPDKQPDPKLKYFSIEKDREYVLPILKLAQQINPELKFFASPWSPPAWMKTNKSMCGGRLNRQYYKPFAEYMARSVEAYRAEGLDIIAITPQNEPEYFPDTYPTCGWTAQQQRDFIRDHLGPVFAQHNLATKIWCYDHNFNHPNFPAAILKDPEAAKYIDGTGFHLYEGKPSAMTWLHEKFPDKHVYFTEGSVFDMAGAVEIVSYLRNWARCYNAWVTVIDHKAQPNPGPHDCSPTCIVLNSETLELQYRFDYYMYGHFMKYIERRAVRIDSTSSKNMPNVALKNPDGSIVLVVANPGRKTQKLSIGWKNLGLETELAARSIATLVWKPSD